MNWPVNINRTYTASSQLFVDLIVDSHLNQLVIKPRRYRANKQPSLLDLIITSDDFSITNLDYLNPVRNSDHNVLMAN